MELSTVVNNLTLSEYVLLRYICFQGDCKEDDANTSVATMSNLLEKELIKHSEISKGTVYPTLFGREVLTQSRIKLGIHKI